LNSWIDPSETSTFSENVSESCLGEIDIDVSAPGLELRSTACADAGAAITMTIVSASVVTATSRKPRRPELPRKRMGP
jgi:hypothetical protein